MSNIQRSDLKTAFPARDSLSPHWWQDGVRALRQGDPFGAHEHWEQGWKRLPESESRRVLQGLIQVAGSFVLKDKRRWDAAERLYQKGKEKALLEREHLDYPEFVQVVESMRQYASS